MTGPLSWLRRLLCQHRAYLDDLTSEGEGVDRVVSVECWRCGKVLRVTGGAGGLSLPVKWDGYDLRRRDA